MNGPCGDPRPGLAHEVVRALADKGLTAKIISGKVICGNIELPLSAFEANFDRALKAFVFRSMGPEQGHPLHSSGWQEFPAWAPSGRAEDLHMYKYPYAKSIQEKSG